MDTHHCGSGKWTHWDLNPGPSACGADVIPLHHVPLGLPSACICCEATLVAGSLMSAHTRRQSAAHAMLHSLCRHRWVQDTPWRSCQSPRARGVVVSHPLSMQEALGSIPSVSMIVRQDRSSKRQTYIRWQCTLLSRMHQPGIEPESHRWQRCILPLDH